MTHLNRRTMLSASGAALVMPFLGGISPARVLAQSTGAAAKIKPSVNVPLLKYVRTGTGDTFRSVRQASPSVRLLETQGDRFHMLARHVAQAGLDDAFKAGLASVDVSTLDTSAPFNLDNELNFLQSQDSTVTQSDLIGQFPPPSSERLSKAKATLLASGLSYHYHMLGEVLHLAARDPRTTLDPQTAALNHGQSAGAHLQYASMTSGVMGRRVPACLLGFKNKKDLCDALSLASDFTWLATATLYVMCAAAEGASIVTLQAEIAIPVAIYCGSLITGGGVGAGGLIIALQHYFHC